MGIRSLKDHCGLAFVAGSIAAREHFHAILNEHTLAAIRGAVDDRLVTPENDAVVVQFPSVVEFATRYLHNGVSAKHGQRGLSRALDQAKAVEIQARLPPQLRARAKSAATPFANAWMAPIPGADNPVSLTYQHHRGPLWPELPVARGVARNPFLAENAVSWPFVWRRRAARWTRCASGTQV